MGLVLWLVGLCEKRNVEPFFPKLKNLKKQKQKQKNETAESRTKRGPAKCGPVCLWSWLASLHFPGLGFLIFPGILYFFPLKHLLLFPIIQNNFFKSLLNLLQYCFCFVLFSWPWDILAPWPGNELAPPALEGEVLTTGPSGKSFFLFNIYLFSFTRS